MEDQQPSNNRHGPLTNREIWKDGASVQSVSSAKLLDVPVVNHTDYTLNHTADLDEEAESPLISGTLLTLICTLRPVGGSLKLLTTVVITDTVRSSDRKTTRTLQSVLVKVRATNSESVTKSISNDTLKGLSDKPTLLRANNNLHRCLGQREKASLHLSVLSEKTSINVCSKVQNLPINKCNTRDGNCKCQTVAWSPREWIRVNHHLFNFPQMWIQTST